MLTVYIPIVVVTYSLFTYYQSMISNETQTLTESIVDSLSGNIETYFNELQRLTIAPYLNTEIMNALKMKTMKNYESFEEYTKLQAERQLNIYLPYYFQNTRDDILCSILLPFDGSIYISSRYSLNTTPGYHFTEQEWYRKAVAADGEEVFISAHPQDYFLSTSKTSKVFSVTRLIKDPDTQKPLAVVMADADTVILEKILKNIRVNVQAIAAITDENGSLLYSSREISDMIQQELVHNPTQVNDKSNSYVVVSKTISPSNWKLLILLDNMEMKSKARLIYVVGYLFTITGLVLTFLLFNFLSGYITRPFKKMIQIMKEVQKGNFSIRFNARGNNEITQLGNALNVMIVQLNDLISREYKAVLNQREAEYQALQAQIQPHFLFNTLGSFIALNRMGDRAKLEKAIVSLNKMLRYVLEHANWTMVGEEFKILSMYCELQKIRFQQRLETTIFCSDEAAQYKIPKLLLQPVVENAVIHGIEPLDRPGKIDISAVVDVSDGRRTLVISIIDNGMGFNYNNGNTKEHVGIRNVQERLSFAYKDATFSFDSKIGEGACIVIKIPEEDMIE
jgi:Predicted signal transduction protein with a C-terminal ATPase domain